MNLTALEWSKNAVSILCLVIGVTTLNFLSASRPVGRELKCGCASIERNNGQFVVKSLVLIMPIVIPAGWGGGATRASSAQLSLSLRRETSSSSPRGVEVLGSPPRQYTANSVDKINAHIQSAAYTWHAHVHSPRPHTRDFIQN